MDIYRQCMRMVNLALNDKLNYTIIPKKDIAEVLKMGDKRHIYFDITHSTIPGYIRMRILTGTVFEQVSRKIFKKAIKHRG